MTVLTGLLTGLTAGSLAAWLWLALVRGRFWRTDVRLPADPMPASPPGSWPAVAAVVPARDEAAVAGDTVARLLAQDYAGPFRVVLVDDGSTDGTADFARRAADRRFRAAVHRRPVPADDGRLRAPAPGRPVRRMDGADILPHRPPGRRGPGDGMRTGWTA